ncbi:Golgi resident protein GCP60 [Teleopsis dalmanni]|uniref:Golgi resident protein GCP60 n=1 Tax=Teleopsis dalmanni TaxID=139649 RepID=UPI0018CDBFE1|nr:Golgi resident protein GCP60 [Teleopsis dalmanni]
MGDLIEKWGVALLDLYRLALTFYKQNSGKAIHLSYDDNLKLIAFKQQASLGPFESSRSPDLGVLDVIGRDRRQHWQLLGSITREQAMEGFIDLLDSMCNAFRPYVEAVKQNREETLKNDLRQMELDNLQRTKMELEQQKLLAESYTEEIQRRELQDELNKQTYQQFKLYAEKQFSGNPEKQGVLIRQLQQEHYHQYMQQLYVQNQLNRKETNTNTQTNEGIQNKNVGAQNCVDKIDNKSLQPGDENNPQLDGKDDYVLIHPAKIWTRPDINDFKMEVASGAGDGVINIGHGDTVTVRVPTNAHGKCIFWEFATDNYDIGFGIYFEWSKPITAEVTVHVSDSDDDDDFIDEDYLSTTDDLECGSLANERNVTTDISGVKPPISIIIPIYRRESFNEVYVGSHVYPGEGVYLIKFDNSYSIWRSKTLYYRVYYER